MNDVKRLISPKYILFENCRVVDETKEKTKYTMRKNKNIYVYQTMIQ